MKKTSQTLAIRVLLFSTFIVSLCGLTYELLVGSLSTNLEGNPILQYSLTIGFFMSALGIGSYLSRFFVKNLLYQFIIIEIILGIFGGLSIAFLNLVYIELYPVYTFINILVLIIIGVFVGLEIPLITRILKEFGDLKETISNVLTIDYIGGLVASLFFPLVLYPYVGLIKTAFIVGFINVLIGMTNLIIFSDEIKLKEKIPIWVTSILSLILLGSGVFFSSALSGYYSKAISGNVVYNKRSQYQNIMVTLNKGNIQLFLDGHLQFAAHDEHRYHESLIYPPFYLKDNVKTVLIMGGGDGLAVREILKFKSVEKIVLVDLDPRMTELAKHFTPLSRLNQKSFHHPKVEIHNQDAYKYLGTTPLTFDVIYADFPDPHDASLAKLYSIEFYHFVKRRLAKDGIVLTQATSPLHAKKAFWCIGKTLKSVFKNVSSYHVNVPSMGDWGFHIATLHEMNPKKLISKESPSISNRWKEISYRFFSKEIFRQSLTFAKDSRLNHQDDVKINNFMEPILYDYHRQGWKHYY